MEYRKAIVKKNTELKHKLVMKNKVNYDPVIQEQ
jgi:hypothetical protein